MKMGISLWRKEQILPLLDTQLTRSERSLLVDDLSVVSRIWPSGRESEISRATYYRWFNIFNKKGSFEPKPYSRKTLETIKPEWLDYAVTALIEEPSRSFYVLSQKIKMKFSLEKAPNKTTLYRYVKKDSRYKEFIHDIKKKGLKRRFEAHKPHYIWTCDAKGSFIVKFIDGVEKKIQVLSIIDDKTRYILSALIVASESTETATQTFINAARRWGLPEKFYADRGSCYDSDLFRKAIAFLGVHRIWTKPRNPSAHGKIEAYHRTLNAWFVKELQYQPVKDIIHLQQLFTAMIEMMYNVHHHRTIGMSPYDALNNQLSQRKVTDEQLFEAFLVEKNVLPAKKTGEIYVNLISYKVPQEYFGERVRVVIQWHITMPEQVYLYDKTTNKRILLKPAVIITHPKEKTAVSENTIGENLEGSLSPLLEKWHGRDIPLSEAGFGLYEIYQLLDKKLKRPVPETIDEQRKIVEWLKEHGPLAAESFKSLLRNGLDDEDIKRPMSLILQKLTNYIADKRKASAKNEKKNK